MEKINLGLFLGHLAVYLFVWVFAVTAQGALTAWMANYYGDDTAKNQGRISLSPFVQADLLGTIIIPVIAFTISWMSMGVPFVAWGKRVPINAENFRKPKTAGVMVTLASTFASVIIAVISFAVLKLLFLSHAADAQNFLQVVLGKNNATEVSWFAPVQLMLWYGMVINIVLVLFSLLPIPPFSGGVVLFSLLPESFKPVKDSFNKFGLVIALLLVYFVVINYVFVPVLNFSIRLLIN